MFYLCRWAVARRTGVLGVALSLVLLVAACATPGTPSSTVDGTPQKKQRSYSIFYDQKDHLSDLIKEGDFEQAAGLFDKHGEFFKEKWQKSLPLLTQVSEHFRQKLTPSLNTSQEKIDAVAWPLAKAGWPAVRDTVMAGRATLDQIPSYGLFDDPELAITEIRSLRDALQSLEARVMETAADDFARFDVFSGASFFDVHPARLSASDFVQENFSALAPKLKRANVAQLKKFAAVYDADILGEDHWETLGELYVAAYMKKTGRGKSKMKSALGALAAARSAGFEPKTIPNLKISFVEITSRTLLKKRALDFPVEIDIDLPINASQGNLDSILSAPAKDRPDYLLVIDVALAKTDRRITSSRKMPARFITGYRTQPNPDYNIVQNQINIARMDVQNAAMYSASVNSQYCYGFECLGKFADQLVASGRQKEANSELDITMQRLSETPMTVDIPIYQNYKYDLATVRDRKTMTVHYYVMDLKRNTYFKSTFDVSERENFEVAYKVMSEDPEKEEHYADAQSESDVKAWEDAPSSVKLSLLMEHYAAAKGSAKAIPSLATLRQKMLKDKNTALASYKADTYEGSTRNDPRFDSVVAVYMPDGGLGSGFYVTPDVIMTNYHVVREGDFVEIKLYGGLETFGKVIAKDILLDLALIKVQSRGKPVKFFNKNELDLGSSVEVIGHPRGYEFSITRGVVSAVRPMQSVNIDSDKKVLQVQIDAPTSPGNSGGPVFMNNKVVSVISWIRVDGGSQNLNFSIHYSEAKRFLKETLDSNS
ncbi:MAG: S1C family serine protease [Alphaproteobacteria bacterium]